MLKKYAFMFPGQGAQVPGMVKDLAEADKACAKVIDAVSDICGVDMKKLLWSEEQAVLNRSDKSQIAITTASLVIMTALNKKGIIPSAAMGFSLGEFPALFASGVLSFEELVRVVYARGNIMQSVCEEIAAANEGHAPGMSAIIGLAPEDVKKICSGIQDCYAANMNSVKQTVISGTFNSLSEAEAKCKEAGARRAIRLAVAGPFHSPLMQKAADEFEKVIASVNFADPKIALFSNVTGKQVFSGEEAKKNAVLHLTNSVLWTDEENILGATITGDTSAEWSLIEAGPGKVLTGLWKDCEYSSSNSCTPVNSLESLNTYVAG